MNHQPYLDWMIATTEELNEMLTPENQIALHEHLSQCNSCQELGEAWRVVELEMQSAPMQSPAQGFKQRWQARLETNQKQKQQKQSYSLLGFLILGVFLMLAALIALALPMIKSPILFLWTWIYQLVQYYLYIEFFRLLLLSIFQTVIDVIPMAGLILIIGFFSQLSVIWIVAMRLTTSPWRVRL